MWTSSIYRTGIAVASAMVVFVIAVRSCTDSRDPLVRCDVVRSIDDAKDKP